MTRLCPTVTSPLSMNVITNNTAIAAPRTPLRHAPTAKKRMVKLSSAATLNKVISDSQATTKNTHDSSYEPPEPLVDSTTLFSV